VTTKKKMQLTGAMVSSLCPNMNDLHFVDIGIKVYRKYYQYIFLSTIFVS